MKEFIAFIGSMGLSFYLLYRKTAPTASERREKELAGLRRSARRVQREIRHRADVPEAASPEMKDPPGLPAPETPSVMTEPVASSVPNPFTRKGSWDDILPAEIQDDTPPEDEESDVPVDAEEAEEVEFDGDESPEGEEHEV